MALEQPLQGNNQGCAALLAQTPARLSGATALQAAAHSLAPSLVPPACDSPLTW